MSLNHVQTTDNMNFETGIISQIDHAQLKKDLLPNANSAKTADVDKDLQR